MFAKTLPLILLCACAATAPLPMTKQPELSRLAQPYVEELRSVGITRVVCPGNGALVRLETAYGPVYVRYPVGVPTVAFVLDVGPEDLQAASASFVQASDAQVLAALLPEALKVTIANNQLEWLRSNPWH